MQSIPQLVVTACIRTAHSLQANWPYLAFGVVLSSIMASIADSGKIIAFLRRKKGAGVLAATAAAVGTPLCSCGTTAVVLGMMAGSLPWGPVVAFMVSSPLTSPEGLVVGAGLFGWPYATAFFASSVVLGLAGGAAASALEKRGWLQNQARFAAKTECGPSCAAARREVPKRPRIALTAVRTAARLVILFGAFAFLGYFINSLIPRQWIPTLFGNGRPAGVPLAATLGIPFYVNSEASLPLVRSFLDSGMSRGASLAFLITGSGTSLGAIAGVFTIARWRVVGLVIAVLWIGATICGFAYDAVMAAGWF
jgi:uncharacterized protein